MLSAYRLVAKPGRPASYPGIAEDYARTFTVLRGLPCDVFLGAHGSYFGMLGKLERMKTEGLAVWVDPEGYRRAVAERERDFREALARQDGVR